MRHRSQQYVYRPASYTEASENEILYILCCGKKKNRGDLFASFYQYKSYLCAQDMFIVICPLLCAELCVCVFVTVQNLLFIHAALSLDHKYHSFIHTLLLSLCVGCIGHATSHILVFHCVCRQIEEWRETVWRVNLWTNETAFFDNKKTAKIFYFSEGHFIQYRVFHYMCMIRTCSATRM